MLTDLFPNINLEDFWVATYETFYMTIIALIGTFILGILLGLLLYLTTKNGIWQNKFVHFVVAAFVNIFRAIPFIILILLLFPFTNFLMGTIRGPNGALPALIIGAAPFYGRLVEIALREVDKGVVEAAKAMGAKTSTIIFKVLLPESMPALISGLTVTAIALIGYTAMAGAIGAGGLGSYAYYSGFQRRDFDIVLICSIIIVIIVFIFQFIGDYIANKLDKR
ncbi:methionine ABC transporter permease [Virgibacillus halodenitrificans]|uniref:ABC transporter permease n=1 Tax=Virgibacillus halodenitrificans TaxID=1482 RepID=A0AAC9NLS1_VIRHA|nr:methionine ABC transporter permease [Virgibacillus halodenitrificans]APC48999.1 methionine ABC transporter permease [Virgibacillus halodenitrificans]MBD1223372.1 ABC transporter permease [Virgibacillus halodenitrificans]MCG1026950.1 ABC transporter permease [Virgibacillus halodenitrificans]MCJ0932700.1 ABC transporter permease [Virgibacillus halodenitrificans]MEC2158998.1 ABC transporter permease [Virgibacillus halodenitrificans]